MSALGKSIHIKEHHCELKKVLEAFKQTKQQAICRDRNEARISSFKENNQNSTLEIKKQNNFQLRALQPSILPTLLCFLQEYKDTMADKVSSIYSYSTTLKHGHDPHRRIRQKRGRPERRVREVPGIAIQ